MLGATAGYHVLRLLQYPRQATFRVALPDTSYVRPVAPNQDYGCNAVTEASVYEDRLDGPTANALSALPGDAAEKVAIKFSADGKGVYVLTSTAVKYGATDAGNPIPLTSKSDAYIVASRNDGLNVETLIVDVKTLKAVLSYTGQGLLGSVRGRSLLLTCR